MTRFHDARQYLIYVVLVGQTPAARTTGIRGSCHTVMAGRLEMALDRDTLAPMGGQVEKGVVNVDYLEHLGTLAVGQFVCSLGVNTDRADREPRLLAMILPGANELTNAAVEANFRTYGLPPALG